MSNRGTDHHSNHGVLGECVYATAASSKIAEWINQLVTTYYNYAPSQEAVVACCLQCHYDTKYTEDMLK